MDTQTHTVVQVPLTVDPKYAVSGEYMPVSKAQFTAKLAAYRAAKEFLAEAKQAFAAAEQGVIDLFDMHEVLVLPDGTEVAEFRVVTSMVLDSAKLRKENPELANKYQRPRYSRGLRVLV